MAFLTAEQRGFVQAIARLVETNPFRPERMAAEQAALGDDADSSYQVWSQDVRDLDERPSIELLLKGLDPIVASMRDQLAGGGRASDADIRLYEDAAVYLLYNRYRFGLSDVIRAMRDSRGNDTPTVNFWQQFKADFDHFLRLPDRTMPSGYEPAHMLACFFQIRRAFDFTFDSIIGGSMPAARLRAAIWESIFTHDIMRYQRSLFKRMADVTTLITGPSGTGKELVAQAIGQSRYIPFDEQRKRFAESYAASFFPLNLSALSPTLIESELFGHRRGAFTGAVGDRVGWLETCPPLGTVFLDEIGELDLPIQVKLLRVLQARTFVRVGDIEERTFHGKVIAATNRDLAGEMREGRFRGDLYYRLCSDIIVTPSLSEQLSQRPEDMEALVLYLARRAAGSGEAEPLTREVLAWINANLPAGYGWPGNVRELEQCVRNVMIRGTYQPAETVSANGRSLADQLAACDLTADEVLNHYCTMAYAKIGSYEGAARRIGLDRRTIKSRIDSDLLSQIQGE